MIVPHPKKGHLTNSDLTASVEFWKYVIYVCSRLKEEYAKNDPFPIQGIALNFGVWETQNEPDKLATGCHGHAHIYITRACLNNLAREKLFMSARVQNPDDHREENVQLLETQRVIGYESLQTTQRLDMLEIRFGRLMETLEILTKNL